MAQERKPGVNSEGQKKAAVQTISLPKGGGAIRGIDEKFSMNPVTGTSSISVPVFTSPGRSGFEPALSISYDSGMGNGPFGFGWNFSIPSITRKTDAGIPQYKDREESDTFILSDAEDLVPYMEKQGDHWVRKVSLKTLNGETYTVSQYRPRVEGLLARIEKWEKNASFDVYWKTVSKDNVHSYYGMDEESRICDPSDNTRIYQWLLSKAHDDKGNLILYKYKKEDFIGIPNKLNEKNRINRCTQTYVKKILYGNRNPYYSGGAMPDEDSFLFKVVFDYGEHDYSKQILKDIDMEKSHWNCRKDPFSSYRAGFEIRTYRRCRRVLVFHCFDKPELPHNPYLVRSLEMFYDEELELKGSGNKINGFSFLVKTRQNGHKWDDEDNCYTTKHLPDMDFAYQQHEWDTEIRTVSGESAVHMPEGFGERNYLWIDLFGEGISGILSEQQDGLFYKHNLGNGEFSNVVQVSPKPSFKGLNSMRLVIQDIQADGVQSIVQYDSEPIGFFKLTPDGGWEPFRNFSSQVKIDPSNKNIRFMDLSGDGLPDLISIEENVIRYFPGLGEDGFEVSQTVAKEIDEEKGPAIIFADLNQSIFLADMSGDGLTDIVRIRNGEICYWPNLGYGRFGTKVNMDNAPLIDHPDAFNPSNLRLADIDGSGTTDIIYLGMNDFRVWMNLSGNEWITEPQTIKAFPNTAKPADISVLDFLGTGTACIVCSSPLPQHAQQPIQYVNLMGGKKPGLLIGYQNNCGKEVSLEYKPSTYFFLEDRKEGREWITKLPFPVNCVSNVRIEDKIRETVLINSYRYSHGYYDQAEREFRGFARVEQLDTEDFTQFKLNTARNVVEEDLHQPPVRTVSWFHTGAYIDSKRILHQCKDEYFKNEEFGEHDLPEPFISDNLAVDELREALRAFTGQLLRSEVYADDNSVLSKNPYSVSQTTYEVKLIQPKQGDTNASFILIPSESVSYSYERNPAEPRISHSLVLETDELGNVTKSVSIVYPRLSRPSEPEVIPDMVWNRQNKLCIIYDEALYTDDITDDEIYRIRAEYETKSYELSGIALTPRSFFSKKDIFEAIKSADEIFFEQEFTSGVQKRLSSHKRIYYLKDDLIAALPLGKMSGLGIIHATYQLAFTKGLVSKYYGERVSDSMLSEAAYVHLDGDENWWAHSGTAIYGENPTNNFYIPVGMRDVFNNESFVEYDKYKLLHLSTTDAINNTTTAVNDYRTLSPVMVIDPNLNRISVESDELGLVVKTAVMGKEGAGEGDTLDDPTTRMEYDLFNWQYNKKPNFIHSFARELHGDDNTRWQESYIYSDGSGNVAMTKMQAEPGKAKVWNDEEKIPEEIDAKVRWLGSGRVILNNKGNPVKQYEPYFSATCEFESEDSLVEVGVTPLVYYDPTGRNVKTEYPDGTFSKIEFNAWYTKTYDVNDTVKDSKWYSERKSPDPDSVPEPADKEQRSAWLAAKHYNTPITAHLDSLGRAFYTTTDFGGGKTTSVYTESDFSCRYVKCFDQMGRSISESISNLLGCSIYGKSAERGECFTFTDVLGRMVRIWDNSIYEFRNTYDEIHRLVSTFVNSGSGEILFGHVIYGDILPDAIERNMKGRAFQLYDQAGVVILDKVDFKGNVVEISKKLVKDYKQTVNWQILNGNTCLPDIESACASLLENETFKHTYILDAMNRPILETLPDKSVIESRYNEASYLDSIRVRINGKGDFVDFLKNQDYDAKGQRQFAEYGNGLITNYLYDTKTFRIKNIITKRIGTDDEQSLQNLSYIFDPVGNIVSIEDAAQQKHYFSNAVVKPESSFEYDAAYQLVKAAGREHAGLGGGVQRDYKDVPFIDHLPHANDLNAVCRYTEIFKYDDCGNILQLRHAATGSSWVQRYLYEYQDAPGNNTNRLKSTSLAGDGETGPYSAEYKHDLHGNMTKMPHLNELIWNFMDQLAAVNLGGGGFVYFLYGLGGIRARKVIERIGGKKTERIYLGAVEIYREYQNGIKKLERSTLHVSDNTGRIAQVDTKIFDEDNIDKVNPLNEGLIRYQYTNHLASSTLETDSEGTIISYEEYHPFGTSSYRVSKSGVDFSLKRYRFSAKERDYETGLYYFGSRYYAAWLARWTSTDPAGFADGVNLFGYCRNNPVVYHDPNGRQSATPKYLPGSPQDRLTPQSTLEERAAFAERHGYRMIDPHPEQQSWKGSPSEGHWLLSDQGRLEPITQGNQGENGNQAPQPAESAVNTQGGNNGGNSTAPPTTQPAGQGTDPPASSAAPAGNSAGQNQPGANPSSEEGFWKSIVSGKSEAGFWKSLIPIVGSVQNANYHFSHGNWGRGILYTGLAILDVFLVKSIVMGAGRLLLRGGAVLLRSEVVTGIRLAVSGNWRAFGNTYRMLSNPNIQFGLRNLIWDSRTFRAVSSQYWRGTANALGMQLQHMWAMNSSRWVPQGLRNAGLNFLEIPRNFNHWMGGIPFREHSFRLFVLTALKADFFGAYNLTQGIMGTDPPQNDQQENRR